MTPEDLRADMPAIEDTVYLNTGASSPNPRRVVDAVSDFQAYHAFESPGDEGMYPAGRAAVDDAREAVARLLSADPSAVTFAESTTAGINLVAGAVDWQPGDVVVRTDVEHPAGILPWQRLRDTHGVEVRVVESDRGRFDLEDFATAVEGARLVCLSQIAWNYGTRLPVREVTDLAHEAGALVLLDAVQAPGQIPVDVDDLGVDFLAGAGHKWLLGPWGAGFLYVADGARERLRPTRIGPRGVEDSSAEEYAYVPSAQLFELTTGPVAVLKGLEAAIDLVLAVGLDTVQDRVATLTDRLKEGLGEDRLYAPRAYESGLVSFEVDDPERFVERAREAGVVIRDIPAPECARASVHVFNTADDIDALLDLV